MNETDAAPARLRAIRVIRRLRGSSGAILIAADDSHYYAVKPANQSPSRSLISERVGSFVLKSLEIRSPAIATVDMRGKLIVPALRSTALSAYFGSRYPVDPEKQAVYDFFPKTALDAVGNIKDFLGVLLMDLWLVHTVTRQAVFTRQDSNAAMASGRPFAAHFIDNGKLLGGPTWSMEWGEVAPNVALYMQEAVYAGNRTADVEFWIDKINKLDLESMLTEARNCPKEWTEGLGKFELDDLAAKMAARRRKLGEVYGELKNGRRVPRKPPRTYDRPVQRAARLGELPI